MTDDQEQILYTIPGIAGLGHVEVIEVKQISKKQVINVRRKRG